MLECSLQAKEPWGDVKTKHHWLKNVKQPAIVILKVTVTMLVKIQCPREFLGLI